MSEGADWFEAYQEQTAQLRAALALWETLPPARRRQSLLLEYSCDRCSRPYMRVIRTSLWDVLEFRHTEEIDVPATPLPDNFDALTPMQQGIARARSRPTLQSIRRGPWSFIPLSKDRAREQASESALSAVCKCRQWTDIALAQVVRDLDVAIASRRDNPRTKRVRTRTDLT